MDKPDFGYRVRKYNSAAMVRLWQSRGKRQSCGPRAFVPDGPTGAEILGECFTGADRDPDAWDAVFPRGLRQALDNVSIVYRNGSSIASGVAPVVPPSLTHGAAGLRRADDRNLVDWPQRRHRVTCAEPCRYHTQCLPHTAAPDRVLRLPPQREVRPRAWRPRAAAASR